MGLNETITLHYPSKGIIMKLLGHIILTVATGGGWLLILIGIKLIKSMK